MGKSVSLLPNFYQAMEFHTYAGTIIIKKRLFNTRNFNLSTVNPNNLKQCFFLVLSPELIIQLNPHEAIKIAKKHDIKIIDLELLALLSYKNF